jgi:hypothetical protein
MCHLVLAIRAITHDAFAWALHSPLVEIRVLAWCFRTCAIGHILSVRLALVLDRELHGSRDWQLMRFERMRILDMVHSFSLAAHVQHQQKMRVARQFEGLFGVPILRFRVLHVRHQDRVSLSCGRKSSAALSSQGILTPRKALLP